MVILQASEAIQGLFCDKNMPPSFGIPDIQDREVVVTVCDPGFQPVREMDMIRSGSGLYRGY
jgi:hypothetical protein